MTFSLTILGPGKCFTGGRRETSRPILKDAALEVAVGACEALVIVALEGCTQKTRV